MKIGFDAKRAFNNRRGLGNYSRETIRILTSLAPENHYYLFTPKVDPGISFETPANAKRITPASKNKLTQDWWRTCRITKEAIGLDLDIYHGLSHELPIGIEKTKIKTVVTLHDLLFLKHPSYYPAFDRMMYRKKYLRSCRIADQIIAVSEQTKRDLLELTDIDENKVKVVYQGCRPEFSQPVTNEQKHTVKQKYGLPDNYLLNVGAFEPRKNQKLLLEALTAGSLDLPVVIAGAKTDYLSELEQYIHSHELQSRVILLPDVNTTDLPALYQGAIMFVFPSLYEGFGIPVIEALESGLPVIAATGSCLEESGGPDSLYVAPDDADGLAEAIRQVAGEDDKRRHMAERGHEYAKRFSDEAIAEQILKIYKNLLP